MQRCLGHHVLAAADGEHDVMEVEGLRTGVSLPASAQVFHWLEEPEGANDGQVEVGTVELAFGLVREVQHFSHLPKDGEVGGVCMGC